MIGRWSKRCNQSISRIISTNLNSNIMQSGYYGLLNHSSGQAEETRAVSNIHTMGLRSLCEFWWLKFRWPTEVRSMKHSFVSSLRPGCSSHYSESFTSQIRIFPSHFWVFCFRLLVSCSSSSLVLNWPSVCPQWLQTVPSYALLRYHPKRA